MKDADLVWDKATLDRFAAPAQVWNWHIAAVNQGALCPQLAEADIRPKGWNSGPRSRAPLGIIVRLTHLCLDGVHSTFAS
jgi:hypothetical protein